MREVPLFRPSSGPSASHEGGVGSSQRARSVAGVVPLFVTSKMLNRAQHAECGNTGLNLKIVLGSSVVPLLWKTEQEMEDVVEALSNSAQRVFVELEEGSAEVRLFYSFFGAAVVAIGAVGRWTLGRKVMTVMAHIVHRNTFPAKLLELKDGETAWKVQGLSSKKTHRVWLSGGCDGSGLVGACACRAFLESGTWMPRSKPRRLWVFDVRVSRLWRSRSPWR